MLGDPVRKIQPTKKADIARKTGWSRVQIDRDVALAVSLGLIELDENKKPIKPQKLATHEDFSVFDNDSFAKDPYVASWMDYLKHKKDGGLPIKSIRQRFWGFKRTCNTLKMKPEQFVGISWQDLEVIMKNLQKICIETPEKVAKNNTSHKQAKPEGTFHELLMQTRSFVQFHGTSIPKGVGGILSGKVIGHGQYPDVKLTDDEIEKGETYIISKYGLDSDVFRVWGCGIEGGARKAALLNMDCEWEEFVDETGKTWYVLKAYETKTESWWRKYISNPKVQESLRLQKFKHKQKKIVDLGRGIWHTEQKIMEALRDVYIFLGKQHSHNGYFMRKPFHALRHISAQLWIRRSNGNYTLVRKVCGWKHDIELEASYGELPAEMEIKMINIARTVVA